MKRTSWQSNAEDPSAIGPSFPRGFRGVLASKTRSNDTASLETQAVCCKKRARFRDLDNYKLQDCASVPVERNQDPISYVPKTSEYAFFMKLKEDAALRFLSHPPHQDNSQSIKFKSSDCSRERGGNIIENRLKDFKSSLPKNVKPDNVFSFISPPDNATRKSVLDMKRADTTLSDVHSTQGNMEEYGDPCKNADIFSRKRHKLRELVAKTSLPEIDELFSKGHDVISVLLSKLFPESNENKSFEVLKTGTSDTDTKSRSLAFLDFDIHFKRSHQTPATARDFMEWENRHSLDVGFPSCWLELPRKRELPNPNFPNCYSHGTYLNNRMTEFDYELSGRATPILFTKGDSAFDFDIKKHRCLMSRDSRHLKEFDEFHCPIEPLYGQEPQTLLLGRNAENIVNKSNLSTGSQNIELSMHPIVPSLHDDDQQQNLDIRLTESRLYADSSVPYHLPNLLSLQFSSSASRKSHNFGESFLKVEDDTVADINNFSLSPPHMTNCLNTSEYSNYGFKCKSSNILPSPLNRLWFMKKILNEKHHCPGKEALCSAGLDFYIEPKCKSGSSSDHYSYTCHSLQFPQGEHMSSHLLIGYEKENFLDGLTESGIVDHLCEDMVDIHDWSSNYFQMPLDKEKACPLLLDKAHGDEYYD